MGTGWTLLYAIEALEYDRLKIGISNSSAVRRGNLQVGNFAELKVIGVSRDYQKEKDLHGLLRKHHVRGEWFRFDEDGRKAFAKACKELDIKFVTENELALEMVGAELWNREAVA